jgi:hypothetical protein
MNFVLLKECKMLQKNHFGQVIGCIADGQHDQFTDGYELDVSYLGRFRPKLLTIEFLLQLEIVASVEPDPASSEDELVVLTTKYGTTRVPRTQLGAQWKREGAELVNLILNFEAVCPGLTDRDCIWIRPVDDFSVVHFRVYPRNFGPNESIAELAVEAKRSITNQLIQKVEPA